MKRYITTPIYYINDVPHIGHAYTSIATDVLARYYRAHLDKNRVFFMTGTDEHGAKIAEAAGRANKTPKKFCDELVPRFSKTWENINSSYDYFIRTTNKRHEKIVQDLLAKIYKKGDIYKKKYEGLYCVGCEKFLSKSDLVKGKCPDHKKTPVKMSEENYFFKLSKYKNKLIDLISKDKISILPETRKNEILSKLKMGLDDISISRKEVTWGIPIPWDSEQTIYVWIDALINYYSGPRIANLKSKKLTPDKLFPADLHLMGKDILWFHAVIWPALCLSAGLKLPKIIFAHGFFTVDGEKMSKTVGNVIDPNEWVKKYGADAVRYYLLTAFPFGEDGDVSEEKLKEKYNNELANSLGNLVNRVVSMTKNYIGKSLIIQKNDRLGKIEEEKKLKMNIKMVNNHIELLQFKEALEEIWKIVHLANEFVENEKPWVLAKKDKKQLEYVLVNLTRAINGIVFALEPFLPDVASKIQSQLKTLKPEPLFPRID